MSSVGDRPVRWLSVCLAVLLGAGSVRPATAAGSDYAEAMRVRRLVILDPSRPIPLEADRVILPVSRGFDQRSTSLCWVYATLSGLETAVRVRQPSSAVELSRRALQYRTIEDRYLRKIRQTAFYTGERGVAVDAMRMIEVDGLIAFDDFTDIDDPYGDHDIGAAVDAAAGEAAKIAALDDGLATVYGTPPAETHLDGEVVSPAALAGAVTAGLTWESCALSRNGPVGYRPHPDPDARAGTVAWFMPEHELVGRIRDSLLAGHPVEVTLGGHCLLIYGVSWDAAGSPTRYYIKDSYPDYFYKADPARLMRNLVEISTVKPGTGRSPARFTPVGSTGP